MMMTPIPSRAAFKSAKPGAQSPVDAVHIARRTSGTAAKRAPAHGASIRTRSSGSDAVQGWIDLAKLVSGGGGFKSAFKDLANKIGDDVYIDVNGWHLYLKDVSSGPDLKMHQALAQKIGEEATGGKLDLKGLLEKVPVKIGGGKTKVSLYEAIPSMGFGDLERIVEDFQRG